MPKTGRTPITFDVDDPERFVFDLETLRGAVCLFHGLVGVLGEIKEAPWKDFSGASELTERLVGFLVLDDMERLYDAARAAARFPKKGGA